MSRRWELLPADPARRDALASALGVPQIVAQVLCARGFSEPERASHFLDTELRHLRGPEGLPDVDVAAARLCAALDSGEKVTVYGDYDVDGTTSAAILVEFLRGLGGCADYYLPNRFTEGYGVSIVGIEAIAARGTKLVITADCGTSSFVEIERAVALGMEVIVIDHHQTPEARPAALALINPHRHDSLFPERGLCSAGLAFYLVGAVRKLLRERGAFQTRPEPNLKSFLDLVALGTIADVAPLVGLNRILVHHGLLQLETPARPGLAELKAVCGIPPGEVSSGQVGFRLGPRINAAGRLGDAGRAVELMLCRDTARARLLAEELDRENARRQELERQVVDEAIAQALADPEHQTASAVVVAAEGWHPGVIGIVASRLVERFGKPAVVIAIENGVGKASARTAGSVHLYNALGQCAELLVKYGGHAAAAGLTVEASRIPAFRHRFREVVGQVTPSERRARRLIDAELSPREVTVGLGDSLAVLRPFGEGNPEPVFLARGVRLRGAARVVGGAHLRLELEGAESGAIGFRMADAMPSPNSLLDLCFNLRLSEWQGRRRAEIHLCDAPRLSDPANVVPHVPREGVAPAESVAVMLTTAMVAATQGESPVVSSEGAVAEALP